MNISREEIARICHEVNAAYCRAMGDDSQPTWNDAPTWQKLSAMGGVIYRLGSLDAPISDQHEAWMAQKEAEGWTWGEVKDPVAKTHPCMVPYDELPPEQQAKDALFVQLVRSLSRYL